MKVYDGEDGEQKEEEIILYRPVYAKVTTEVISNSFGVGCFYFLTHLHFGCTYCIFIGIIADKLHNKVVLSIKNNESMY